MGAGREEGVMVLEEGHAGRSVGHCLGQAPKRQSLRLGFRCL